jgi:aminomethyltransferase
MTALQRTPLYHEHLALSARMVPFAGFEMPVQYPFGILREHEAVRRRAGLFDLSHMAQYTVRGAHAAEALERITVNAVGTQRLGQARYNLFCNERGGTHDDVIVYRLAPDEFLVVANAANAEKIWDLLKHSWSRGDYALEDGRGRRALIALQGPASVEVLRPHCSPDPDSVPPFGSAAAEVCGHHVLLARTGYTGEDGFEIYAAAGTAADLWRSLLRAGEAAGVAAAGLGARDMLRIEAGLPLYGHELGEEISPLQARLDWAVKFDKGEFTGRAALLGERAGADRPLLAGIVLEGRAPARSGYAVFAGGRRIGEVSSATTAPALGGCNVALAFVERAQSGTDRECAIEIRGERRPARMVALPFYRRKEPHGTTRRPLVQ